MGGVVPHGYRVEDRKLVIDEAEANEVSICFWGSLFLYSDGGRKTHDTRPMWLIKLLDKFSWKLVVQIVLGVAVALVGVVAGPDSGPSIDDRASRPRAIADVEGLRIEIKRFRIVGLSVATAEDMEEDLAGFLGPNKRFQDLLDAAAAIKRKLAGLGFFLADVVVPEQKIANGIVELRVLEGRLCRTWGW